MCKPSRYVFGSVFFGTFLVPFVGGALYMKRLETFRDGGEAKAGAGSHSLAIKSP